MISFLSFYAFKALWNGIPLLLLLKRKELQNYDRYCEDYTFYSIGFR